MDSVQFSSVSVVSDSLRPHESQHARPPSPSPTPRIHPNSCPSSWWCHPATSSSVVPFSIYNVYNYICNVTRCICVCVCVCVLSLSLSLYIYIYTHTYVCIYIYNVLKNHCLTSITVLFVSQLRNEF